MPPGIHLGIGSAAMVVLTLATAAFTSPGTASRLLVMALGAGLAAALIPDWRYAGGVALIGYLLYVGFLVNQYGELSWNGRGSLWHLAVFALAFWIGLGQRWMRKAQMLSGGSQSRQGPVKNTDDPVGIASGDLSAAAKLRFPRSGNEQTKSS